MEARKFRQLRCSWLFFRLNTKTLQERILGEFLFLIRQLESVTATTMAAATSTATTATATSTRARGLWAVTFGLMCKVRASIVNIHFCENSAHNLF